MRKQILGIAVIALLAGLWSGAALGLEIEADQQIDGATPQIVGTDDAVAGDNTITPSGASPNWTYTWADRAGDGTSNAVATAGLNLGIYKLYANSTATRGTITLDLSKDDTNGNIEGTGTLAIRTNRGLPTSNNQNAHNLTIKNVGSINVEGIDTSGNTYGGGYYASSATAGNVTIGAADNRAGSIRAAYIYARRFDNESRPGGAGGPGSITIYSDSNVLIKDSSDEIGDIRTDSCSGSGGNVTINHVGDLIFKGIYTYMGLPGHNYTRAGNITLNGGNSSGDLQGSEIYANQLRTGGYDATGGRPSITISHYGNVTISNAINSSTTSTSIRYYGGHLTINNVTNITIGGSINLRSAERFSDSGYLSLACDGTITLAELDLDKVLRAELSSGSGTNTITGELLNFSTAYSTGAGTVADPYLTTQTALRLPADQTNFYNVAASPYLGGRVYKVASLAGTAAAGGLLMPNDYNAGSPAFTPMIDTDAATDILHTSATLNGTLTDIGSSAATVSVYWSAAGDQGFDPAAWTGSTGGGSHTFAEHTGDVPSNYLWNATSLSQNTTYTYRYRATNTAGDGWGYAQTLLTLLEPQASLAVSEITHHSAKLTGTVTAGNPNPTAYFCLKAGSDPSPVAGSALDEGDWDSVLDMGTRSASFTYTLGSLTAGTTYYAYVYVDNGTSPNWSSVASFSTGAMPTIPANLTLAGNHTVYNAMAFSESGVPDLAPIGEGTADTYDFSSFNASHASLNLGTYNIRATASLRPIRLRLNNGDLLSNGGYIETSVGANTTAGDIDLFEVGDIILGNGYIRAHKSGGGSGSSGTIRIGTEESPAGSVQAAYIECTSNGPKGIYIHSDGNVHMTNTAAVAGNLDVSTSAIGDLHVLHAGSLKAAAVKLIRSAGSSSPRQYEVVFDGAAYAQDQEPSGSFEVEEVIAYGENNHSGHHTIHGHTTIVRNYLSVLVKGEIDTRATRSNTGNQNGNGGDITITNIINDITIDGPIQAQNDHQVADASKRGILTLQAGGQITLGSLDLSKVQYATFEAGVDTEVNGTILGDDGLALSDDGNGTATLSNGSNLRLPAGQTMVYHVDDNPLLIEGTYTLADENGSAGDGGLLRPWRARATVFRFY